MSTSVVPCPQVLCLRLRTSRVLIVGMAGLGAEVSKNIVLAGVQEVTLLDSTPLDSADIACRFLMQQDGINVSPFPPYYHGNNIVM